MKILIYLLFIGKLVVCQTTNLESNGFLIIEVVVPNSQMTGFTVPKLQNYLLGKKVEIARTDKRIKIEDAKFIITDFSIENLIILDVFKFDFIEKKGRFLIIRTDECIIRFERDEEKNFNVECDCINL